MNRLYALPISFLAFVLACMFLWRIFRKLDPGKWGLVFIYCSPYPFVIALAVQFVLEHL